jgi:hypothetical protein
MVAGAIAGNISPEATIPSGNIFADAMRGDSPWRRAKAANRSLVPGVTRAAMYGFAAMAKLLITRRR